MELLLEAELAALLLDAELAALLLDDELGALLLLDEELGALLLDDELGALLLDDELGALLLDDELGALLLDDELGALLLDDELEDDGGTSGVNWDFCGGVVGGGVFRLTKLIIRAHVAVTAAELSICAFCWAVTALCMAMPIDSAAAASSIAMVWAAALPMVAVLTWVIESVICELTRLLSSIMQL